MTPGHKMTGVVREEAEKAYEIAGNKHTYGAIKVLTNLNPEKERSVGTMETSIDVIRDLEMKACELRISIMSMLAKANASLPELALQGPG